MDLICGFSTCSAAFLYYSEENMATCRTAVAKGPGWEPVYFIHVSVFANSGMYVWIFMGKRLETLRCGPQRVKGNRLRHNS